VLQDSVLKEIIKTALDEDIGSGDVTTSAILSGNETGIAHAIAKADMVVAGIDVFKEVFLYSDSDIRFDQSTIDGQFASAGDILVEISGGLANILTSERVALNLLQRLCGIATLTRQFVDAVKGTPARILDTRKTVPGLRMLDKYAVRVGGGYNHRIGLYDGILIKENHIEAAGGIAPAVQKIRTSAPHTLKIEIETRNMQEVKEALSAGVDIIMLDNMKPEAMKRGVEMIHGRALVEASGNVTLASVRKIAECGVDFISIGALTHSARAADISLLVKSKK
jgi:nicotinate-nucleotide pyrophosphorylase (carboxylating)